MTRRQAGRNVQQPRSFMPVLGGVILVAVALYFGFMAIDGIGLSDQTGTAIVVDKEYRESGLSFATQPVGGRNLTRVQATPEMYLLHLKIDGNATACPVPKALYQSLSLGDQVQVIYQQRRLIRKLQVTDVRTSPVQQE